MEEKERDYRKYKADRTKCTHTSAGKKHFLFIENYNSYINMGANKKRSCYSRIVIALVENMN